MNHKLKLQNLREAGQFLGFSMLSIMMVLFVLGWITHAFNAQATTGINKQLNYQGKLNDSMGTAIADGSYDLKFVVYDAVSAGNCLWTAVGACDTADYGSVSVTTVNGVFSLALGDTGQNSIATSSIDFNTDSLYLGVTVESDSEMTPRKRIASSAYAFNADMIDGLHATSTEAIANYLIGLDANKILNLYDGGVSSTRATTSEFVYIGPNQDGSVDNLDRAGGDLYIQDDVEIGDDLWVEGSATTTGQISTGWNSRFGTDARHISVVDYDLGGIANVPMIKFNNPGGAALGSPYFGAMYQGLVLLESDVNGGDANALPKIIFSEQGAAATSQITFATTTNQMKFEDAISYTFDNRVGINTTTPYAAYVLAVDGNEMVTGNSMIGGNLNVGTTSQSISSAQLFIDSASSPWSWSFEIGNGNNAHHFGVDYDGRVQMGGFTAGATILNVSPNLTQDTAGMDIAEFKPRTGNVALYIDNAGDVGIGTSTPRTQLTVVGSSYFDGQLYVAEDVYIDDQDGTINLGRNGSNWESLMWDNTASRFEFTDDLHVTGNVTTTGHLAALGGNSDQWNLAHSSIWTTASEQNFWNTTSTWTAYDTNWARNANATSTYPGFASQFETYYNATTTQAGFATQFTQYYNATTTLNGFTDNSTNWNTAYGWGDWSTGALAQTDYYATTTWAGGNNDLVVTGNATTTGNLTISGDIDTSASSYYKYNGINLAYASTTKSNYFFAGAGNLTMTGGDNTASGYQSLNSNTSGYYNAAYGHSSLGSNTTGIFNTAYGHSSLFRNISGSQNLAFGRSSLHNNTTGNYNTAVGSVSLEDNSSGDYNTVMGYNAGENITTGYYNTIIGTQGTLNAKHLGITTGDYNTIIGAQIEGLTADLQQNIIIADGLGNQRIRVDASGNVGIATTTPWEGYKLSIDGSANVTGSWDTDGADYAEYFYTVDTDLQSGEVVCVDLTRDNAVKRCNRQADSNVMGIVSSKPAIIGNNAKNRNNDPNYAIIGMLGQVPAKVNAENGEIRPGDSLTSASTPGYAMRANSGDSTVGIALERLESETDTIQVMISRRNKSITVDEVEGKITQHIAEMEIEDEVNLLVASAIESLNLDEEISEIITPELALLDGRITVETDGLNTRIDGIDYLITDLQATVDGYNLNISSLQDSLASLEVFASSTANTLLSHESKINTLKSNLEAETSNITYLQTEIENIYDILNSNSSSTSPLIVSEPDLELDTLVVQESATFYGTIYVRGEANFEHKVVFEDDIEVQGKIYVSSDQAGSAVIETGATSTEIVFNDEYEIVPKIAATAQRPIPLGIIEQTTAGFIVYITEPATDDLSFDWIALAVIGEENQPLGEPPIINNVLISRIEVGLDEQIELWVVAEDNDTPGVGLSYSWSVEPSIGSFTSQNSYITNWSTNSGTENVDLVFTINVSDGQNNITETASVRLVINEDAPTIAYGLPTGQAGCVDNTALNYNSEAQEDDGTCEYDSTPTSTDPVLVLGCTDETALNYNLEATENDDSCEYEQEPAIVLGCMNLEALNYNPEAQEDDESCEYLEILVLGLPTGQAGCTDDIASNYDPSATEDDGTCYYPIVGCIDSEALNYDPQADLDNGSCEYQAEDGWVLLPGDGIGGPDEGEL